MPQIEQIYIKRGNAQTFGNQEYANESEKISTQVKIKVNFDHKSSAICSSHKLTNFQFSL